MQLTPAYRFVLCLLLSFSAPATCLALVLSTVADLLNWSANLFSPRIALMQNQNHRLLLLSPNCQVRLLSAATALPLFQMPFVFVMGQLTIKACPVNWYNFCLVYFCWFSLASSVSHCCSAHSCDLIQLQHPRLLPNNKTGGVLFTNSVQFLTVMPGWLILHFFNAWNFLYPLC